MIDQDMTTQVSKWNLRPSWRGLSVMLTVLLALVLMTTMAFAQSDDDTYTIASEASNASNARSMVRAGANPSMNVAQWYTPAAVNSTPSTARMLRADANPSMDVAQWYAPSAVSGAPSASWTVRAGANPSMNVAQWYAPEAASNAPSASRMLRADANPSMNVAQWYLPAGAGTQDLLCVAEDVGC